MARKISNIIDVWAQSVFTPSSALGQQLAAACESLKDVLEANGIETGRNAVEDAALEELASEEKAPAETDPAKTEEPAQTEAPQAPAEETSEPAPAESEAAAAPEEKQEG